MPSKKTHGHGRRGPSNQNQKSRTLRNKIAQRKRHAKANPNDKMSLARAKRWVPAKA